MPKYDYCDVPRAISIEIKCKKCLQVVRLFYDSHEDCWRCPICHTQIFPPKNYADNPTDIVAP